MKIITKISSESNKIFVCIVKNSENIESHEETLQKKNILIFMIELMSLTDPKKINDNK